MAMMTMAFRPVTSGRLACLVVLIAGLHLAGCGSSTPAAPTPAPVVLLDTMVTLAAGVNCTVGYAGAEFPGTAGTTVAISATGASTQTPLFILYAPDFATQLATSASRGAGAASLTFALTQTGVHHLSICDVNGIAGTLRITVQQQK
jgi:hypothetical protein